MKGNEVCYPFLHALKYAIFSPIEKNSDVNLFLIRSPIYLLI